jgi:hypothetical protein
MMSGVLQCGGIVDGGVRVGNTLIANRCESHPGRHSIHPEITLPGAFSKGGGWLEPLIFQGFEEIFFSTRFFLTE